MTLYEQWLTFFATGVAGVLMGVYYDALRESTQAWPVLRRWQVVLDGLFWLGSLVLVAAVLWFVNQGVFRWHIVLGLLAGVGVYGWLLSRGVRRIFRHFYRMITWTAAQFVRLIHRLVITPLFMIGRGASRMGRLFLRWPAGIFSRIANLVKRKDKP